MHNFKVNVSAENLEGSKGLEYISMNQFLVTKIDKVIAYDCDTYQAIDELPIKLLVTETREPNEVIAMQKDQNEEYLAVISGKNLIANEQKTNQLFVYKRTHNNNPDERDKFEFLNRIVIKDIPIFT